MAGELRARATSSRLEIRVASGLTLGVSQPQTARSTSAATDRHRRVVYLTEDATPSGLYRLIPNTPGVLVDGGKLQMM